MRAVILAGGKGTRLAPYTTVIPKPLLPVGDTPILEIMIRQLAHSGFNQITLTLGYMSEYIKAFLDHHKSLMDLVNIDFVEEEKPTGTAGSLATVSGLDDKPFLVMNGDILTNLDFRALFDYHVRGKSALTIALHKKPVEIDLGVIETDGADQITDYIEKPVLNYMVSMGIYAYAPAVMQFIPCGEYLDFPTLVLKLIGLGQRVAAYPNDAFWLDLGRREDLERATEIFLKRREEFLPAER